MKVTTPDATNKNWQLFLLGYVNEDVRTALLLNTLTKQIFMKYCILSVMMMKLFLPGAYGDRKPTSIIQLTAALKQSLQSTNIC